MSALPDFEYPVPYAIRNTFVDVKIDRSLSLEELYEERRVRSCPIGPPPGLEGEAVIHMLGVDSEFRQPTVLGGNAMASVAAATKGWVPGRGHQYGMQHESFHSGAQSPILQLAGALAEHEFAATEVPTVG